MSTVALRWQEFDRQDRLVTKQKEFDTEKQMDRFFEKIQQKDNFCCLVAFARCD